MIGFDICCYDNILPTTKNNVKNIERKNIILHSTTQTINSDWNPYTKYFSEFDHLNHQFKNYKIMPEKYLCLIIIYININLVLVLLDN